MLQCWNLERSNVRMFEEHSHIQTVACSEAWTFEHSDVQTLKMFLVVVYDSTSVWRRLGVIARLRRLQNTKNGCAALIKLYWFSPFLLTQSSVKTNNIEAQYILGHYACAFEIMRQEQH